MIVQVLDKEMYLDGYLKADMDFVKKQVLTNNNLFICLVDGRPGTGKSTLVSQLAFYLNPNFNLDDETFTIEQFEERLKRTKEGDVVILDEGFEFNKRRSQSMVNMRLLALLQTMRLKKIFIFIIVPFLYDLDKNVILGLSDMFIHCWREPFGKRGQFSCYDRLGEKLLWLYCRQTYSYSLRVTRPIYRGRFVQFFPLDYGKYEDKKVSSLVKLREDEEPHAKYLEEKKQIVINLRNKGMPVSEIIEVTGMKKTAIYEYLKEVKHD